MEATEGEGDKSWLEMLTLGCVSADCFTTRKSKAKNLITISSLNDLVSLPQERSRWVPDSRSFPGCLALALKG